MLRSLKVRPSNIRFSPQQRVSRQFHCTPTLRTEIRLVTAIEFGRKLPELNPLFEYLLEYTSLPLLLSVPLVTIFFRLPITPFRYVFSVYRRNQRRAQPELRLARAILEQQADTRSEAGVILEKDAEGRSVWVENEWEMRKAEIVKKYPHLGTQSLVDSTYNRDITALGVQILAAVNTVSIISLSCNHPELFTLGTLEYLRYPLLFGAAMLAISNTNYYANKPLSQLKASEADHVRPFDLRNLLHWTDNELKVAGVLLLPAYTMGNIAGFPAVVALSVFSNSAYTWLEIFSINAWLRMPDAPKPFEAKAAIQTTKRKTKWSKQTQD